MTDLGGPKSEAKSARFQFKFVDEATAPGTFEGLAPSSAMKKMVGI
jgi:hypothetical protein